MHFNEISNLEYGGPFVQRSGTICANVVEGIMRKNSVKLYLIWTSGSGEMPSIIISHLELWRNVVQQSRTICAILVEGINRNNTVKLFCIWTRSSEGDVL